MRYDKRIYFIRKLQEEYDPIKGEWVGGGTYALPKYANVTDLGSERSVALFGNVMENALTVRLLNRYKEPFDTIRIDGTHYSVIKDLNLRRKHTLIVKEVDV